MSIRESGVSPPSSGVARTRPGMDRTAPAGSGDRWQRPGDSSQRGRVWRCVVAPLALLLVVFGIGVGFSLSYRVKTEPDGADIRGILPGEFEPHDALLFAWTKRMLAEQRKELAVMVAAVQSSVDVMIIGEDDEALEDARRLLAEQGVASDSVRFLRLPNETPWIRDFGPRQIKSFDGTFPVMDALTEPPGSRQEHTPREVARALGLSVHEVDLAIDGGNLISNGAGLCLTTHYAFEQNALLLGMGPAQMAAELRDEFGAIQLAVLRQLPGESTGHVDTFATFTGPDTVVVGQYDPEYDPESAKILDENARYLAELETARGRLNVVRIPLPRRRNDRWLSYTNVVYANGVLLVPAYSGDASDADAVAQSTYRELLPGWQVVPVAAEALMVNHGGPHCATAQLFRVAEAPVLSHPPILSPPPVLSR